MAIIGAAAALTTKALSVAAEVQILLLSLLLRRLIGLLLLTAFGVILQQPRYC